MCAPPTLKCDRLYRKGNLRTYSSHSARPALGYSARYTASHMAQERLEVEPGLVEAACWPPGGLCTCRRPGICTYHSALPASQRWMVRAPRSTVIKCTRRTLSHHDWHCAVATSLAMCDKHEVTLPPCVECFGFDRGSGLLARACGARQHAKNIAIHCRSS